MKKLFSMAFAISLGILIGMTSSVFAAQSEYVQATFQKFKLVINGDEKELSSDPLVYKGTTYLPVRTVFDAIGYEVKYDPNTKTINASGQMEGDATLMNSQGNEEIEKQIKVWEDQIAKDQKSIQNLQLKLEQIENDENPANKNSKESMIESTNKSIEQYQTFIDQARSKIKDLEAQLK